MKLRDRDAIVTKEGLVFRVLGYSHPSDAYICDIEYAPSELFQSANLKAPRGRRKRRFFKFYENEGWKFLESKFPKYLLNHDVLQTSTVGVRLTDIAKTRKPKEILQELLKEQTPDELVSAMKNSLKYVTRDSGLSTKDFGVFGSMLHGFHHPRLSDIDLLIYGKEKTAILRKILTKVYDQRDSPFRNEFETDAAVEGKHWRFRNLSPQEYVWHQQRKTIYAVYKDEESGRSIKTEFEPVKDWAETHNEYDPETKITQCGWVKLIAEVTGDSEASFIPSVYNIKPTRVFEGPEPAHSATRIISYLEEFRMQAWKGEIVYVEGNFEEVRSGGESSHQITLTYCPEYYEQVLKSVNIH